MHLTTLRRTLERAMERDIANVVLMRVARDRAKRIRLKQKFLLLMRMRTAVVTWNHLTTDALQDPADCAWHVMYKSTARGSFINTVSIDPDSFDYLLHHSSLHYIVKSGPGKQGHPAKFIGKHSVLACILHFYTAAVEAKTRCELFGVPPTTFSRVMANEEVALFKCLQDLPEAAIRFPNKAEQHEWARLTNMKEPVVQGVWGFVDGKNYKVQEPTPSDLQKAYYNGLW